jgi:hypothetical protein
MQLKARGPRTTEWDPSREGEVSRAASPSAGRCRQPLLLWLDAAHSDVGWGASAGRRRVAVLQARIVLVPG